MKWHTNLEKGWDTLKNYFVHRVTTGISEGINRAIKGAFDQITLGDLTRGAVPAAIIDKGTLTAATRIVS